MTEKIQLSPYFGGEKDKFTFYKLPKLLFTHSYLQGLSTEGKVLYALMHDRLSLSFRNKWQDKEGRVYIIFSNEEASEILGKCPSTVTKVMAELDEVSGFGLIERKKQGLGKPDLIFVKNLADLPKETVKKRVKTKVVENPELPPQEAVVRPENESSVHQTQASPVLPAQVTAVLPTQVTAVLPAEGTSVASTEILDRANPPQNQDIPSFPQRNVVAKPEEIPLVVAETEMGPMVLDPSTGEVLSGIQGETVEYYPQMVENSEKILEPVAVNSMPQSSTIQNHSTLENTSTDLGEVPCINTKSSYTEMSETNFLRPTHQDDFSQQIEKNQGDIGWWEGWEKMAKLDRADLVQYEMERVYRENPEQMDVFFLQLRKEKELLKLCIEILLDVHDDLFYALNVPEDSEVGFDYKMKKLYASALTELIYSQDLSTLRGAMVSYSHVLERFLPHIIFNDFSYSCRLDSIADCTIQAYLQSNEGAEIKYPLSYMKSCIWSTFQEGCVRVEGKLRHDFAKYSG